ncbi:MAG: hypothetical protein QXL94_02930, partial [Candidatus Parvarchaeum sp.]
TERAALIVSKLFDVENICHATFSYNEDDIFINNGKGIVASREPIKLDFTSLVPELGFFNEGPI